MKATCPSCQTSYRVGDEKVPDGGAQIKCPKCSTLFVVRRPDKGTELPAPPVTYRPAQQPPPPGPVFPVSAPPAAPVQPQPVPADVPQAATYAPGPASPVTSPFDQAGPVAHDQATPLEVLSGGTGRSRPAPPSLVPPQPVRVRPAPAPVPQQSTTPNLDSLAGEAFVSLAPAEEMAAAESVARTSPQKGVSAIRAQSGTGRKPAALGLQDGYRVRTQRGLTYDFSTRDAMERWLADRDDLGSCEVSEPGGSWVSAKEVLAQRPLTKAAGSAPLVATAAREQAPIATFAKPIRTDVMFRTRKAGAILWGALSLSALLVLAGAAVTLTRYGIMDFSPYLPLAALGIRPPAAGSGAAPAEELKPLEAVNPDQVFSEAMGEGTQALRSKKFSRAALEFNRALSVRPGSVDALEALAKAYLGLGDMDRARAAQKKAQSIGHR